MFNVGGMLKCKTDLGFTTFYICPQPTIYMDLEFYINPHPRETDLGVLCFTAPKMYNGLYFFDFNPHSPNKKMDLALSFTYHPTPHLPAHPMKTASRLCFTEVLPCERPVELSNLAFIVWSLVFSLRPITITISPFLASHQKHAEF